MLHSISNAIIGLQVNRFLKVIFFHKQNKNLVGNFVAIQVLSNKQKKNKLFYGAT
jgi:hypothetical protein